MGHSHALVLLKGVPVGMMGYNSTLYRHVRDRIRNLYPERSISIYPTFSDSSFGFYRWNRHDPENFRQKLIHRDFDEMADRFSLMFPELAQFVQRRRDKVPDAFLVSKRRDNGQMVDTASMQWARRRNKYHRIYGVTYR